MIWLHIKKASEKEKKVVSDKKTSSIGVGFRIEGKK